MLGSTRMEGYVYCVLITRSGFHLVMPQVVMMLMYVMEKNYVPNFEHTACGNLSHIIFKLSLSFS